MILPNLELGGTIYPKVTHILQTESRPIYFLSLSDLSRSCILMNGWKTWSLGYLFQGITMEGLELFGRPVPPAKPV